METTKTINNAMSTDNGIICYSNLIPFIGVRTYHDEEGNIKKDNTFGGVLVDGLAEKSYTEIGKEESKIMNIIVFIVGLLLIIIYNNVIFAAMLFYIYTKKSIDNFIMFYKLIIEFKTKHGAKRQLAKYHGAEHKVIMAYNKKHDIPTLEEAKKTSRFAKECSSMRLFNQVVEDACFILFLLQLY